MELYIIRHAIAEMRASSGNDGDRALTEAGREKMARAARGLRKLKVEPELILTSPLRRARETAEIVSRELGRVKVQALAELAAGADVAAIVPALRPHARRGALAIVGHMPDLSHFASLLLTGSDDALYVDFKKGGVACIEADLSGSAPRSQLRWLATPKLLRAL
jgi:phosphohistidine phosphatase